MLRPLQWRALGRDTPPASSPEAGHIPCTRRPPPSPLPSLIRRRGPHRPLSFRCSLRRRGHPHRGRSPSVLAFRRDRRVTAASSRDGGASRTENEPSAQAIPGSSCAQDTASQVVYIETRPAPAI
ncbi:hypothetical protein BT93_D0726 [Corymbia citriodora subsp. variegata]|nr:hypothetical protein BT93_D0726 [Corymbia citriodora subsp. variegata]